MVQNIVFVSLSLGGNAQRSGEDEIRDTLNIVQINFHGAVMMMTSSTQGAQNCSCLLFIT